MLPLSLLRPPTMEGYWEWCLAGGMDDDVSKPVNSDALE
jgi:hypothetical protein